MRRIESRIDPHSESFRRYDAANRARVAEFHERQDEARNARPKRDLDRLARQGKLLPRQRIEQLLDPGTPFLELSSLAACTEYAGDAKSASAVVGIGVVSGREVIIRADEGCVWKFVVDVMNACNKVNISDYRVATSNTRA